MPKRRYNIIYIARLTLEVDEKVFQQVDKEWRETFYNLKTDEEVVKHIAYNRLYNNTELSALDGFCDLNDNLVKETDRDIEDEGVYLVGRK